MRRLILLALAVAGCSYSEEKSDIKLHVTNIPADADHLNAVLTPSDTSVASRGCTADFGAVASNAQCYRPTFQPGALDTGALDLDLAQPSATGTFTVSVDAANRNGVKLATGTVDPTTLPGPIELVVPLH